MDIDRCSETGQPHTQLLSRERLKHHFACQAYILKIMCSPRQISHKQKNPKTELVFLLEVAPISHSLV